MVGANRISPWASRSDHADRLCKGMDGRVERGGAGGRPDGCRRRRRDVFREVASCAKTDRAQPRRGPAQPDAGDLLMVASFDRLARSTFDLFAIVKRIAAIGARFRSLAERWADTGTRTGRLLLAVLVGLADVERALIRTHTAEGRSRAKARGQHLGRPPFPHRAAATGSPRTPCGWCDVEGAGAKL